MGLRNIALAAVRDCIQVGATETESKIRAATNLVKINVQKVRRAAFSALGIFGEDYFFSRVDCRYAERIQLKNT